MISTTVTKSRRSGSVTPMSDSIETEVSYLVYDPKHQHEKPYRLNYDAEVTIPKSNTDNHVQLVRVHDFRPLQTPRSFHDAGFTCTRWTPALRPDEYGDDDKVKRIYYPEVAAMLKTLLPDMAHVEILEHQVRRRHVQFPVATGQPYDNVLPATLAHVDFTPEAAIRTSQAFFKDPSERYSRLMTVNVWKSLQGPGNDWPLALCDRRTIDHMTQLIGQDVVFHDRYTENARVYYDPRHRWYYFPDLALDEAICFVQTDSSRVGGGGVPHTGIFNPRTDQGAAPRESIEIRAYVYFD